MTRPHRLVTIAYNVVMGFRSRKIDKVDRDLFVGFNTQEYEAEEARVITHIHIYGSFNFELTVYA